MYHRYGDMAKPRTLLILALLRLLLSQSYARAAAVLVDELGPGPLGPPNNVKHDPHACPICKLLLVLLVESSRRRPGTALLWRPGNMSVATASRASFRNGARSLRGN